MIPGTLVKNTSFEVIWGDIGVLGVFVLPRSVCVTVTVSTVQLFAALVGIQKVGSCPLSEMGGVLVYS